MEELEMKLEEAIILAGGMGTRLKGVISDIPKPLAPVNGLPFLTYLIKFLKKEGIKHIVLSVGYKWEMIKEIYGDSFEGIDISYAVEKEPLGTGGGIALALKETTQDDILILNGDSFIDFDLKSFYDFHKKENAALSFVLKEMNDFERYGSVEVKGNKIIEFREKKHIDKGLINAGAYIGKRNIFDGLNLPDKFSFEQDYLEKKVKEGLFFGYKTKGYFIDIGIPEDYNKAEIDFKEIWK
ncbi:MAG: nucleotidyltransferase family protein [Bacteroidales bacterium]|nr:nucleotidyltransferase family protein [Bacteroidales bacterium]